MATTLNSLYVRFTSATKLSSIQGMVQFRTLLAGIITMNSQVKTNVLSIDQSEILYLSAPENTSNVKVSIYYKDLGALNQVLVYTATLWTSDQNNGRYLPTSFNIQGTSISPAIVSYPLLLSAK